jgi:hypothetical protein
MFTGEHQSHIDHGGAGAGRAGAVTTPAGAEPFGISGWSHALL